MDNSSIRTDDGISEYDNDYHSANVDNFDCGKLCRGSNSTAGGSSSNAMTTTTVRDRQQRQMAAMTRFWSTLRMKLSQWENKLNELVDVKEQSTIVGRNGMSLNDQLDSLRVHLTTLRQRAIAVASGETTWEDDEEDRESDDSDGIRAGPYEGDGTFQLTAATDWRLLHDELRKYTDILEDKTKEFLQDRTSVFRFYRYRKELDRRRRLMNEGVKVSCDVGVNGKESQSGSVDVDEEGSHRKSSVVPSSVGSTMITIPQSCFRDLSNGIITIDSLGQVTMEGRDKNQASTSIPTGIPVHLWNLTSCTVKIQCEQVPALYLIGVNNSTLIVSSNVSSAVHITDCHQTTIRMEKTAQQMRIHKSDQLSIHVFQPWTNGAIIMEDSNSVNFEVNVNTSDPNLSCRGHSCDDVVLDVKDFNWLRGNIPSPNFIVNRVELSKDECLETAQTNIQESSMESMKDNVQTRTVSSVVVASAGSVTDATSHVGDNDDKEEQEEDEDEL